MHTSAVHFHCCPIDGVFAVGEEGQVRFAEAGALTPEDLTAVQQQVRARVLRWFARAGHLDPADARDMARWRHGGGFSLDASVRIDGHDRAGLERLLRYCARPARWSGSSSSPTTSSCIAGLSPSPMGAPGCASRPWN
jgi:hypothetical protein